MRGPTILERISDFCRKALPQVFCHHDRIILDVESNEIIKGYCDYCGHCEKCGKWFRVIVEK